jgi:hypothetical protein
MTSDDSRALSMTSMVTVLRVVDLYDAPGLGEQPLDERKLPRLTRAMAAEATEQRLVVGPVTLRRSVRRRRDQFA